jgi:hypothetical protein
MKISRSIAPSLIFAVVTLSFAGCGGEEAAKPAADAPKVEDKAPGSSNPASALSNPYNPAEKTGKKAGSK